MRYFTASSLPFKFDDSDFVTAEALFMYAGIELALYFTSVWLMLHGRERRDRGRSNRIFLVLSTGLLCMITIFLIVQAMFGQEMWILNEDYPGGTAQYFADHAAVWYETLGSASSVVLSLMSDAFLVSILTSCQSYEPILMSLFRYIAHISSGTTGG